MYYITKTENIIQNESNSENSNFLFGECRKKGFPVVALWNRHNLTRNPRLLERIIKNYFISFLHFKYKIPIIIPIPYTTAVTINGIFASTE